MDPRETLKNRVISITFTIALAAAQLALAGAVAARAEEAAEAPADGTAEEAPGAPAEERQADPTHPRGSVLGYLLAARATEWEDAADFLNLRRLPPNQRKTR